MILAGKADRVIAFGSFDILHPGHLLYLRKSKRFGRKLIVIVARDSSIKKLKGRKAALDENARLEIVKSLRIVDKALLGSSFRSEEGMYGIIERVKPDVIAVGYDQKLDIMELKEWLGRKKMRARIVRISSYYKKYKSSGIRRKIAHEYLRPVLQT